MTADADAGAGMTWRGRGGAVLPRWVLVPAAVGLALVVVPVVALVLATPWPDLPDLLTSRSAVEALWLSLRTSVLATVICAALGVPLALVLARASFPGQRVVRALVLLPLALPPVVGGVALLEAFGRRGLVGEPLAVLGLEIGFTTAAVVLAQTFVALPFLVLSLEGALRGRREGAEDVAATLGAAPSRVLTRVTLPAVAPGLVSGLVLAWARALGEFGATITFAGSLPGVTQTLPLHVYVTRSSDPEGAIAMSLLLVVVALVVTTAVYRPPQRPRAARAPDPAAASSGPPPTTTAPTTTAPADPGPSGPAVDVARPAPAAATVTARVPDRDVDATISVAAGEVVAVVGPNGAGKSTLLAAAAGLVPGTLAVDDGPVEAAPVHRRRVGWVPQQPTAVARRTLDDVAFGPRAAGLRPDAAHGRAHAELRLLDADHLAEVPSTALSGGQARRVAIARALAADPRLLLLDEPFASLDTAVAHEVRTALRDRLAASPCSTLLVTHDPLDLLLLADRVVVMEDGRVVDDRPVADVLGAPRTTFTARLAGINLLRGTAVADGLDTPTGRISGVPGDGGPPEVGAGGVAVFDPAAVAVHRTPPGGSPRNTIPVRVTGVRPHGALVRVHATSDDGTHLAADLTPAALADLDVRAGERLLFVVKAAEVRVVGL